MLIDEALLLRFHKTLAHRKCEGTADSYRSAARQCVLFLTLDLERPVQAADLDRRNLQKWLDGLPDAPATIMVKCAAMLRLSRYIRHDEGGPAPAVPPEDLEIPKVPHRLPHFLTVPQVEAVLAAPLAVRKSGLGRLVQLRDVAILEVLNAGGLRSAELRGLDLPAVQRDSPRPGVLSLRVIGKGNRERYVPIGGHAAQALVAYLEIRAQLDQALPGWRGPRSDKDEAAVFLSQERGRLSERSLHALVVGYGRRVGLKVWPHLFRHTCATQLLSSGADLREVQEFLGHTSPVMTSRYAHVDLEHLYSACTARHPRSRPAGSEPQGRYNPLAHEIADILHERMKPGPVAASAAADVCPDLGPVRCALPVRLAVQP